MYTDTKNLTNGNIVDMTFTKTQTAVTIKPKRRLRKVWKPLLRLLSPKTETNGNHIKHPNNIYLNNTTNQKDICDLLATLTVEALPKTAPFDSELEAQLSEPTACEPSQSQQAHFAVIKSASIDKTPAHTCHGCAYGRNCQHFLQQSNHPAEVRSLCQSDTDDNTLAWITTDHIVDEELLNAWYYYNSRQVPVHTQASLC